MCSLFSPSTYLKLFITNNRCPVCLLDFIFLIPRCPVRCLLLYFYLKVIYFILWSGNPFKCPTQCKFDLVFIQMSYPRYNFGLANCSNVLPIVLVYFVSYFTSSQGFLVPLMTILGRKFLIVTAPSGDLSIRELRSARDSSVATR